MVSTDSGEVILESTMMAKLEQAITTARGRLVKHDEYVGKKEMRTRVLIIDEILRGLGWEVTSPELVQIEFEANGISIDYVLLGRKREYLAVVEAKRSKEVLSSSYRIQAAGYATEIVAKYAVLTNGARWESWEINTGQPLQKSKILEVNITTGDIKEIASQLAIIHREVLERAKQKTAQVKEG